MKKQTKWITAAAVIALSASLAVAGTSFGEGPGHGCKGHGYAGHEFAGRGRHHRDARLADKLNLTGAQKDQWKAIRQSSREQNEVFFQQARQTRQDFRAAKKAGDTAKADALKPTLETQRAQMEQIREANHQQFLNLLTAGQRAQFETLQAERTARRSQREGRRP